MKNLVPAFLMLMLTANTVLFSQSWQKTAGGSGYEFVYALSTTTDGGYITAGYTESSNGDISGSYGNGDCWVIKYNSAGMIEWSKVYGGSAMDYGYSVEQTADGGYIVAGYTESSDGEVSIQQGNGDAWVLKLTGNGAIAWQKTIGGSQYDSGQSIQQTSDGGYILAGYTGSNDGDVSLSHGGGDCFMARLDGGGNIDWIKCYGGSDYDYVQSIRVTAEGGYVFSGYTHSADGDVSLHLGNADCWIVKTDHLGNIAWEKSFGGTDYDCAQSIRECSDGGYIITGSAESFDMDVTGNHGNGDMWVIRTDDTGTLLWQKCLGSSESDHGYSAIQMNDGTYIVAGYSGINDGDVSVSKGTYDAWTVHLSGSGAILDQYSVGGTAVDIAYSVSETTDGGYIIAGYSESNDGDVSGNHGGGDCWIYKFPGGATSVADEAAPGSALVISQENGYLSFHGLSPRSGIRIYDISGRNVITDINSESYFTCYLGNEAKGMYLYSIMGADRKVITGKLVLR